MSFRDDIEDPFYSCQRTCPIVYIVFHFRRYRPLKLPLSCEIVVLGPRFVGRGDTPDFGHAFSNRTHFRQCGRFYVADFGWVSFSELGGCVAKKERRRIPVKFKSADNYVGRPNKMIFMIARYSVSYCEDYHISRMFLFIFSDCRFFDVAQPTFSKLWHIHGMALAAIEALL